MADFKEILVDGQVYKVKDETARANAGGGGEGTVTGIKVGSTTYEPTEGVVDISAAIPDISGLATKSEVTSGLNAKVDKNGTDSLMTAAEHTKLANIAAGAEVNVQPDWGQTNTSADDYIKNKPNLATVATSGSYNDLSNKPTIPDTSALATKSEVQQGLSSKQDTLKSTDTLMTINGSAVHYGESVTVQGEKGDKGDTGDVQVDGNGNVLIYNGRDMTTPGAALDASQGQFLGKMLNAKDNTFYKVWVGTANDLELLDGDYDDNTIYIVGVVATAATRYSIDKTGIGQNITVGGTNAASTQIQEGKSFSLTLSPASGYTIDTATGTMVGGTLTKTENQDGSVTFSTSAVTGNISISAAATKHIQGITVSAGTRTNNSIPLSAVVAPSGADNVTLAWSVNDTTNFAISGNGTSATLTVKSGANNSSVTITCQDTNAASGTAQGTLQLTGLTYEDEPIPITEITDITPTRTAANTLTLDATADGNSPAVTYSLVGTVPTVKQVRRWAAGDTVDDEVKESAGNDLIELPAVELSGNVLTYKGDCQVTVRATAGSVTHDETIDIVHDNADAIWFEDEVVKQKLMTTGSKGTSTAYGSNGEITYAQAAEQGNTTANGNALKGSAIIRFNEWKYFTYSYFNVTNCSKLESIELPKVTGLSAFDSRFGISGTKLTTVEIPEGYTTYGASSGSYAQLPIQGTTITSIVFPTSLTNFANKIKDLPNITKVDLSNTALQDTSSSYALIQYNFQGDSSGLAKLAEIDLPIGIFKLQQNTFRNCSALRKLTLRYDGVVANNSAFQSTPLSSIDLYVPANQVSAYQASSTWSDAKSINAITE